jgi:ketosteroid isomerase-like protein
MTAMLASFHPDAAVKQPEVNLESYRGRGGIISWAQRWHEALQGLQLETQNFVESDDHVVVLSRLVAYQEADRKTAEARFAHVWTVENGKVREMRIYLDWKRAMEAAGLRG